MIRAFKYLFWSFLALLVATLGYVGWLCYRVQPQSNGTIRLHGLQYPVEVVRDSLGVPHVLAQTFDDAIFAQGYVTAQDRLWQMDLLRRMGYGELSEIFGGQTLETDREQRVLGFKRLTGKQEQNLPPEDLHCLRCYSEGVNAFIQEHGDRFPIEFKLLGYQPALWSPRDTLALSLWLGKLLSTSWQTDLMREMIYQKLDRSVADQLLVEFSPDDVLVAGNDTASPRQPAPGKTTSLSEEHQPLASFLELPELRRLLSSPDVPSYHEAVGSNNWAISGNRAQGGKPILANDPHLPHSVPCIWYMAHLQVPGDLNVTGVTIPGAPGIVLGHNENIAWGATNLGADVQDLYVETVHPQDPNRYLVDGSWQPIEQHEEVIAVKGQQSERLRVKSTRHGPVVKELKGRLLALRWTLLDEKVSIPIAHLLNRAGNWEEFLQALQRFSGPTQNFVYADRQGNIGFADAGRIPMRRRGDGSVPVPGENDEYEWTGIIPFGELPRSYNPASGIIVTANNRVVGTSYSHFLTHHWMSPHRASRIQDLLESKSKLTPSDMLQIQGDVYSSNHRRISMSIAEAFKRLEETAIPVARRTQLRQLTSQLQNWDYVAREDSTGSAVCEMFREVFLEEVLKDKLGEDWKAYHWFNSSTCVENLLKTRDPMFLPKTRSSYDAFILNCLLEAADRLIARYRIPEPNRWRWGDYLPVEFKHPLGRFWPLTTLLNTGPTPQPGTPLTIKQTSSRVGVSMRMVVDFSDLDQSLNNVTLGQSGQVFSAFYRDQFTHWLQAQSYPMLFTVKQIRKAATATLRLLPQ